MSSPANTDGHERRNTSSESRYDSADASPGFLLWKVANLHQKLQRRELDSLDLTPTQFSVLACYGDLAGTGEVTQAAVCNHAALDKMIVSDATRALVDKGLLARTASAHDGRAAAITLTRQGRATCNRALRVVEALDASFFERTGNLDSFVRQLRALLG